MKHIRAEENNYILNKTKKYKIQELFIIRYIELCKEGEVKENIKICKFFINNRSCLLGKYCRYSHIFDKVKYRPCRYGELCKNYND